MTWKPDYTVTPHRIVCAANMHKNGDIILGLRHFDKIMHSTLEMRSKINEEDWQDCEEGFVDQFGDFIDRETAWLIASESNQIFRFVGSQTKDDLHKSEIKLYSENLY